MSAAPVEPPSTRSKIIRRRRAFATAIAAALPVCLAAPEPAAPAPPPLRSPSLAPQSLAVADTAPDILLFATKRNEPSLREILEEEMIALVLCTGDTWGECARRLGERQWALPDVQRPRTEVYGGTVEGP